MKKVIWVVFALLLHSAAGAQGFSLADEARRERERREGMETDRQRLLKEVLKHTNAAEALAQLSKGFSDSADKMFGQFPHEARDPLKKATLEALSSSRLLPVYERSFSTGIDIMTLTAVSDWSKTAIGAKIFRVETVENGRPDENFLKRPVSRNRSMLIEELERETKETERAVAAVTSLSHAMLGGMLESSFIPQQTKDAFLSGYEQAFAAAATPWMAASIRNSNLFVYRNLSDEELEEYIAFITTPAGRKFNRVTWEAMQDAMKKGGADAGRSFGQIVKQMANSETH